MNYANIILYIAGSLERFKDKLLDSCGYGWTKYITLKFTLYGHLNLDKGT